MGIKKLFLSIETGFSFYLVLVILCIGIGLYAKGLTNDFVWDDQYQIVENRVIHSLSNVPQLFTGSTFNRGGSRDLAGSYYKPLLSVFFAVCYSLFGASPFGYHLLDLLLHLTNTILIFYLLRQLFKFAKLSYPQTLSFFLSLIFLIHPANVEAVAYIASSQELLYTFFLLLCIIVTWSRLKKDKISIRGFIAISTLALASVLSKESGIVCIFLLPIFTKLFYPNKFKKILLAMSVAVSVYIILRVGIAHSLLTHKEILAPIQNVGFSDRLITIPYEIFSYMRLLVFPKDLFIYQDDVIHSLADIRFLFTLPIIVFVIVLIILILKKTKSKLGLFFALWFGVGFFFFSNIIPLDMTIAERWLYGPMIGVLGFVGVGADLLFKKKPRIAIVFAFIILLTLPILFIRSSIRIGDWKSLSSLYLHDIQYEHASSRLENNTGAVYYDAGKLAESAPFFMRAIALSPYNVNAYDNLALVYHKQGKLVEAERYYYVALLYGGSPGVYENYATLLFQTKPPQYVLEFLQKPLALYPDNPALHRIAALCYQKLGQKDKARQEATTAFYLDNSDESAAILDSLQ